jgi:branched-chain amino acid transport system substrate-binding protein
MIILLIGFSFFLISSANKTAGKTIGEDKKLKVGVIISLTGKDAYFGSVIQKGMLLANKDNSVELIIEDFGSETKNAPTAVNKLINFDKVDVLLTEFSEDTLASVEAINKNKIPTICIGCGSIGVTRESEYLFRVWPSDELEVKSLVSYAKNKGYKKVAVLQTISVWENSLTESFENNWDREIIIEKAMREDSDFRTQLLKIREFNPDFIYLACYEQKYPLVLKQLREMGTDAEIGTTSWINDPTILETCGKSCEGLIVPQYSPPSSEFVAEYKAKYGEEPALGADVAYDAVKIVGNLKSRDKESILQELLATNYEGASGKIEFNIIRDRKSRVVNLYRIWNQRLFLENS